MPEAERATTSAQARLVSTMFSKRTAWERKQTALATAVAVHRATGAPLIDLTASNPTRCGFSYGEALLAPLSQEQALLYDPEPFGLTAARQAVCDYYSDHGATIYPQQVCLTTSTSEAYSFLFRLLCDPGDEVLIAQPSYPLFSFLADLDDVRLVTYPLFYDHGWQIESGSITPRVTDRTRAVIAVHPNNPTGHYVSAADRLELEHVCAEHGLALLVDEVFLDYPLSSRRRQKAASFALGEHGALTFLLSGLSKVAALPQMKASWIVTFGPEAPKREALERLELIADTFLSMNAPVQNALPAWLKERGAIQTQITKRTQANLAQLDALLWAGKLVSRLELEAGWYAVLRVPVTGSDDELVGTLVEHWGVLAHPGHYYGLSGEGWLVVSLLPPEADFEQGIRSLLAACHARSSPLSEDDGEVS